jgi:glycerate kinase
MGIFAHMETKRFRIAVAPDSFKGSLSALEAAGQIERGLKDVLKGISVRKIPMADGGEGTVQAIVESTGGRIVRRRVSDPLGRRIDAHFGLSGDAKTAVLEMAAASGLALLKPSERNPMKTTTRGTGELIRCALKLGARHILVGIGGSATNDGGMGMARALGIRFLDKRGREIAEGGGALSRLARIDPARRDARIDGLRVEVACDVDNPLTCPYGAAHVYSPQKGATPEMARQLDANLGRLAQIIKHDLGIDILAVPGAGAAGGLGAGLMAFLGGVLRPGVDMVIDSVGLKRRLQGCDLVITGEGRMDGQTVYGKTPAGVARTAKLLGLPVIAICGSLGDGVEAVHGVGIDIYFSSLRQSIDESEFPVRGPHELRDCARQVGRLLALHVGAVQRR